MLRKYQIWVEAKTGPQYAFQKLHFGNNSQKLNKIRYQTFLFLLSFTGFFYFLRNILSGILVKTFRL